MTDRPTPPRSDPFTLDIPQADLDDLRDRLDRARWPDELPGDVDDGIKQSYVRSLYDYWRNGTTGGRPRRGSTPIRSSRPRSTARTSTSSTSARPSRTPCR